MSAPGEEAVEAINGVYGRHPACRAAHARGIVCEGSFEATPQAAALTRAAHMQGEPVPATVRFSNASGDPNRADSRADLRGLATKFHLPGNATTDLLAVTLPCFTVSTPEDFIDFTRRARRSPLRPLRVLGYYLRHPRSRRGLRALVFPGRVSSYARCRYNGIHAFRWLDDAGRERYVRYSWVPIGEAGSSRRRRGRDKLAADLAARLAEGPVEFGLELRLAAPGDPVDDATAVWPESRETLKAGTLTVSGVGGEADDLLFDPTRVTDGIELSPDPLLRFRPEAYAVSYARRSESRAKVSASP